MWSSPVPEKALPTGNRSLKAFEAKGSPPASPSLTKFSASLRMRNRYHGTNLSREHSGTNVIACVRNIGQRLPNHLYLHPLHFGCLSFIIWPYIDVKCIILSGALSVTARAMITGCRGRLPLSEAIFSIFLIATLYTENQKESLGFLMWLQNH